MPEFNYAIIETQKNLGVYSGEVHRNPVGKAFAVEDGEVIKCLFSSEEDIAKLSGEEIRRYYNLISPKHVNKFESKTIAVKRLFSLATEIAQLGRDAIEVPVTAPVAKRAVAKAKKAEAAPEAEKPADDHAAPAATVRARSPRAGSTDPIMAFGMLPISNRARILNKLAASRGEQVKFGDVVRAVYGKNLPEFHAPTRMILKGLFLIQEKTELSIEIRKVKTPEGMSYGLYDR